MLLKLLAFFALLIFFLSVNPQQSIASCEFLGYGECHTQYPPDCWRYVGWYPNPNTAYFWCDESPYPEWCDCGGGGGGGGGDNPKGFHDESRCDLSYGWACDQSDYNQPLEIKLYADGSSTPFATTTANKWSEQGVVDSCGGTGNHRFDVATPNSLKDGNTHSIVARATNVGAGGDADLSGTPKQIQCAPPPSGTISAAPNPCYISVGNFLCNSTINWNTANTSNATVCVNTGVRDIVVGTTLSGPYTASVQAAHDDIYTLYNSNNTCSGTVLASTIVRAIPPPPTGLTVSCPSPGTQATLSWTPVAWATSYALRVDDSPNSFNGTCAAPNPGDVCTTTTSNTYTMPTTPNHSLGWWLHSCNAAGCSALTAGTSFTCNLAQLQVNFKDTFGNAVFPPSPNVYTANWDCNSGLYSSSLFNSASASTFTDTIDYTVDTKSCFGAIVRPADIPYIIGVTPIPNNATYRTSNYIYLDKFYGWQNWLTGTNTLNIIVRPPACTLVYLKNFNNEFGQIDTIQPVVGQINYAYSDVLTGTTAGATCEAAITGCANTINRSCYVSPDPSTANYRARVDFTPTIIDQRCTVIFKLHPPALPSGDTCNGTSPFTCARTNGVCGAANHSWSCNSDNTKKIDTITRIYTPLACGGNDVSCVQNEVGMSSCDDSNTCTDDACDLTSSDHCRHTNNFGVCPAFMKINGGDVHANKKTSQ